MARGIDLLGLLDRSVVQPQDDITVVAIVIEVGSGNGDRFVGIVGKYSQRASRIEANSLDQGNVNVRLVDDPLDAMADTVPDVRRGLFLCIGTTGQLTGLFSEPGKTQGCSHSSPFGVARA